jgi:NAD(P)-dependent dehydrogenase (short-subunit alcohol dehydrogenase family)
MTGSDRHPKKTVLITGANSGIGKSCAIEFSSNGYNAILLGRNEEANKLVVSEICSNGFSASSYSINISNEQEVKQFFEKIKTIDCIVNNAGITGIQNKLLHEYTYIDWKKVIDTNLAGTWLCMKYGIPLLLKNTNSSIVNISSISGISGRWLSDAYVASKHAIIGLTKSVSRQYAGKIRVNAVCPGPVNTPLLSGDLEPVKNAVPQFVPLGRMAEPVEIARLVLWICSEDASYITGSVLVIDGGATA